MYWISFPKIREYIPASTFSDMQAYSCDSKIAEAIAATAKDPYQEKISNMIGTDIDSLPKDYIFYYTGTNGHIWSLISSDSAGLHISNGTTRSYRSGEPALPFDTVKLLEDHAKRLEWAFDSLSIQATRFKPKPIKKDYFQRLDSHLYIVKDSTTIFVLEGIEKFKGKNSKRFNTDLNKLRYMMLWISFDNARQYLPTPNDTFPLKWKKDKSKRGRKKSK